MSPFPPNERGGALIATLVISLLLLSVLVWHLSEASLITRIQSHENAGSYALQYAESGLLLAEQALQMPRTLEGPGRVEGSLELPNGGCAYTLIRRPEPTVKETVNPFESVLVDAYATGYYYLNKGKDPQTAILQAKVSFRPLSAPKHLGTAEHFPTMSSRLRAYYKTLITRDGQRLKDGSTLDGRVERPGEGAADLYYCNGDLHLGSSLAFEPAGPMVVYVEGNLIIHRSITGSGASWAAFLVEKNIRIDPAVAVHGISLRGNFITNGALSWSGSSRPPADYRMEITGSLLAGRGVDPALAALPKEFLRWQLDDAMLPLPRTTQILETRILTGKYRR